MMDKTIKLLVISDSHGRADRVRAIASRHKNAEAILFLGDGIGDLELIDPIASRVVCAVRGNCDFFSSERVDRFVIIEGVKIFMTHGDKYGVKSTLRHLYNNVVDYGVDIVLFGHTHLFCNNQYDKVAFLNPGSLSYSRGGASSYAVMVVDENKFSIEKCSF